jgi:hypothetical protein
MSSLILGINQRLMGMECAYVYSLDEDEKARKKKENV